MKLGSSTATLAAALLMTTGCANPERAAPAAATHPDSATPIPGSAAVGDTSAPQVVHGTVAGEVTYDSASGRYTIMVHNDAGDLVPMRVGSPARVKVRTTASVVALPDGSYRYEWVVRVANDSPKPLDKIWIPCPAGARIDSVRYFTTRTRGRMLDGVVDQEADMQRCWAYWRVDQGDSMRVELFTNFLPASGSIAVQAMIEMESWPTSDPTGDNAPLSPIVDSLSGLVPWGVHVPVASLTPTRAPDQLASPAEGVRILLAELSGACGGVAWITDRGVCRSLQAKLDAASAALGGAQPNTAKDQLTSFRTELNSQRGRQMNDDAYFLLSILADRILSMVH